MSPLKKKIIIEYNKLVKGLNVGKQYNYDHIIDMINLLYTYNNLNRPEFIESHFINLWMI